MAESLPLSGITVVELGHSVAAPYAGLILAGLGAAVIKVENPEGGDHARGWGPPFWHGAAAIFQTLNRDKIGVTVDLKDNAARERLRALILERADVVLQNMRPGVAKRFGLGAEDLRNEKPALVYCTIGAFGATGPLADKPGYDPLMQGFAGIMSVTGEPDGEPVRAGTSIIDMGAGMWAAIGVLAALERRHRTGEGGVVETSLLETGVAWMAYHVANYLSEGMVAGRYGSGTPVMVPYQAFTTTDGAVIVAAGNDAIFARLCSALGRPDWIDDERFATNAGRVVNREDLIGPMEEMFRVETTASWIERLNASGVPCAPIHSVDEMLAHPQTQALEMVQPSPDAEMALVGLPLSFEGQRPPFMRRPPALGEHDAQIFGGDRGETGDD